MLSSVILPWLPIVLASAVGAKLVGPFRSQWLGAACAVYFFVVAQMTSGVPIWADAAVGASVLAGSASILGIAEWSSGGFLARRRSVRVDHQVDQTAEFCELQTRAMRQFDSWLELNRHNDNPWATFGEFIRHQLFQSCRAKHVRPYRVGPHQDGIVPLRSVGSNDPNHDDVAIQNIVVETAKTGHAVYPSPRDRKRVNQRKNPRTGEDASWCFAVRQGRSVIGVVAVGGFNGSVPPEQVLVAWQHLISQFWLTFREVFNSETAVATDPVSGLMRRDAFVEAARKICHRAQTNDEPVTLCVIAVEGLRRLSDEGNWSFINEVIGDIGRALREYARPGDLPGRLDDSRFTLLLYPADADLSHMIARQLALRLSRLIDSHDGKAASLAIRCGVVEGADAGIEALITESVAACNSARRRNLVVSEVVCLARGGRERVQ
jgi:GGDEF domain-containing protein